MKEFHSTVRIRVLLAVSIGLLVLVSTGTVLFIGIGATSKNTTELLGEQSMLTLGLIETTVVGELTPAEYSVQSFAERFEAGELDLESPTRIYDSLMGAAAAAPQLDALLIYDNEANRIGIGRDEDGKWWRLPILPEDSDKIRQLLAEPWEDRKPLWQIPVSRFGVAYASVAAALVRDGARIGTIVAAVSLRRISSFIEETGKELGGTAFILYGDDRVLAHPELARMTGEERPPDQPTVHVSELRDPVLSLINDPKAFEAFDQSQLPPGAIIGEVRPEDVSPRVVILQTIDAYGPRTWGLGVHFPREEVGQTIRRMILAAIAGVIALIVALIAAWILGEMVARPIRRVADWSTRISKLDIHSVGTLDGSRIKELDEQAIAFNRMLSGLNTFERFVPRRLVQKLVDLGKEAEASEMRTVTVMFTDIAGYTPLTGSMGAAEIGDFLNHHFECVVGAINASGGTVDKYIGDAVMAFWGAPDEQEDHAARALDAANAIVAAVAADNEGRKSASLPPVRMRIGIHSGEVLVGAIGATDRVNYTVVGEAVNIAQRLEAYGKSIAGDEESVVLVGTTTRDLAGAPDTLDPLGEVTLRGVSGPVGAWRLKTSAA